MTVMDTALHIHGYQVRFKKTSDKRKITLDANTYCYYRVVFLEEKKIIETLNLRVLIK